MKQRKSCEVFVILKEKIVRKIKTNTELTFS